MLAITKLVDKQNQKARSITLVGCRAHARRKYDEALKALGAKESPAAVAIHQGLKYCNKLFKLEEEIRDISPEERMKYGLEKAKSRFLRNILHGQKRTNQLSSLRANWEKPLVTA